MFNLNLHNFRSFQNQKFNFSRINIFIGENSGGKSSLLKFLLSLKQTLESPNEFNLKLKGDFTDLGNYEEVIYKKNKSRKLKFSFSCKDEYLDYFFSNIDILEYDVTKKKSEKILTLLEAGINSKTEIEFILSNKLNNHKTIETTISNSGLGVVQIIQNKGSKDSSFRDLECDVVFKSKTREYKFEKCLGFKEGFFTLIGLELKKVIEKKHPKNFEKIYYPIVYLLFYQNYVQDEIEKIRFVNPIGNSPKRFYFQEDKKASYKLIDIEKFINVIGDTSLSKKQYDDRLNLLNKTIKQFGIADEIELIKDEQIPILALNVKTRGFWSNITDVGYGVSLQIPIIFQALLSEHYTRNGNTILIEQPEVHLHPSLQAKFVDTLLSIGDKNTYFIETHSEHIIRKLQVLVKNNEHGLKPEDVTIHYFKRNPEKFEITSHQINSEGQLSPEFPAGFFDTTYSLVKELL